MQSSTKKLELAALSLKTLEFNLKGTLLEVRTFFLLRKIQLVFFSENCEIDR